jgi:hypothetical protein
MPKTELSAPCRELNPRNLLSYPVYARTINPPAQIGNKRIIPSFRSFLSEKWKLWTKVLCCWQHFFPPVWEASNPGKSWPDSVFSILLSFYPGYKETLPVFLSFCNALTPPVLLITYPSYLNLSFTRFLRQLLVRSQQNVANMNLLASPCVSVCTHVKTRKVLNGCS